MCKNHTLVHQYFTVEGSIRKNKSVMTAEVRHGAVADTIGVCVSGELTINSVASG